jgi:hypothetical protein
VVIDEPRNSLATGKCLGLLIPERDNHLGIVTHSVINVKRY